MQQAGEAARRDLHAEPEQTTFASGTPRCATRRRARPARGRAAPRPRRVVAGRCRPCTRRRHCEQRPTSMSKRRTMGHLGEFFLYCEASRVTSTPAAVGTRPRRRRRMGLVNPRRAAAASLPPVPTGPAASPAALAAGPWRRARLAVGPRGGRRRVASGVRTTLPPVPVAGGAGGAPSHKSSISLAFFRWSSSMPLSRGSRRIRTAASEPCSSIGSCAPNLHSTGFSRLYPVTKDGYLQPQILGSGGPLPLDSYRTSAARPTSPA